MTPSTHRRIQIADAAIATLAGAGMRGFTHRAVDRTAGLAEGSSSYYFRTRSALLLAAVERMAELDEAEFTGVTAARDLDDLADQLAASIEHWLTTARERTLARYEFTLEAARRPELRARLVSLGALFRTMATDLLRAAGAEDPERRGRDLVAYLDGLAFDQLVGAGARPLDRGDIRASCRDLLRAVIG